MAYPTINSQFRFNDFTRHRLIDLNISALVAQNIVRTGSSYRTDRYGGIWFQGETPDGRTLNVKVVPVNTDWVITVINELTPGG